MPSPPENNIHLVSVIVTSFNHAEYLRERIDSLLAQTYENIEIIVIDDCSTDNSLQVLKQYESHPRIKIIALEKNRGYADACNLGVNVTSGDFIMFAECDDRSEPDQVRFLIDKLKLHEGVGVAFSRSNIIDSNGKLLRDDFECREDSFKALCSKDTVIPKTLMQRFLLHSCVIPNMSAALIKKNHFMKSGGLSSAYSACADWDFWCRMAMLCDFYYVAMPLNNFRTHSNSVRSTFSIQRQVCEMFDLLHTSASRMHLDKQSRSQFNVSIGSIWAGQFRSNPVSWIKGFLPVWKHSLKYNILTVWYLILAIFKAIKRKVLFERNHYELHRRHD